MTAAAEDVAPGVTASVLDPAPDPRETVREDIIWLLARLLDAAVVSGSEALASSGVGLRAYQVLTAAVTGCSTNQLTMARALGVDRSVMVGLVDELERAGLVERKPDPADRRSRIVTPTELGRERAAEMRDQLAHARDDVLGALDAEDRELFVGMLQRVVDAAIDRGLTRTEGTCPGGTEDAC
jgi:DNA-binding MarR family transcriptional regulator